LLSAPPDRLSLKRRVFGAGAWSLAGFALSNTIRLGSSLLLTRLLVPQMFGVMAIAGLIMAGLAMFSDIGLRQNIIQSQRGGDATFLNTVWTVQILRGLVLWLAALCVSMLLFAAGRLGLVPDGSVYADAYLPYVIAVVSFSAVVDGLQSTKVSEASRRLVLGRITLIQIAAQIFGLFCMINWVLIDRSIWALVAGGICSSLVTTLLSHTWLPGVNNRWQWDRSELHEILHFGKWMFLSSVLGFFANNADRVMLGGFVDSATLGIYSIAFTIFNSIAQVLSKMIADVSYSAFSEVARERSLELKRTLYRFHLVTASFAYFCSGFFILAGGTLIGVLYDRRYAQAGWMLEVLSVALLAVPFNLAQYSLLARGLPRIFTNIIAIRVAITIVFIPLGFHMFGILGAIGGIVIGQLSSAPVTIYYQLKFDLFELSKELLLLLLLLVGGIIGELFNFALVQHGG
jgi:O-antigen/teichoic acid export membrane protein